MRLLPLALAASLCVSGLAAAASDVELAGAVDNVLGRSTRAADYNNDRLTDVGDVGRLSSLVHQPARFAPGTRTVLATATIGSAGGFIIGPDGSALAGVTVTIPPGGLSSTQQVEVGVDAGRLVACSGLRGSVALFVSAAVDHDFRRPMTVTLPLTSEQSRDGWVPVPYLVRGDGLLDLAQLLDVARDVNAATFSSWHDGTYTWIWERDTNCSMVLNPAYSGFDPSVDGFHAPSLSLDHNAPGENLGMTTWASWYYRFARVENGRFEPRFIHPVGGGQFTGQDVLATRSHAAIINQWPYYGELASSDAGLTAGEEATVLRNGIRNTAAPVPVFASQSGGNATHSVLATSYYQSGANCADVVFQTYDPMVPDSLGVIIYATYTHYWYPETWVSGNFDSFLPVGVGSLKLDDTFQRFLEDANNASVECTKATSEITSIANNSTVELRQATLSGVIHSGTIPVSSVRVIVDSTPVDVTLGSGGHFSTPVPVHNGSNYIFFDCKGMDNGVEVPIECDIAGLTTGERFVINGDVPRAAILVTVTWDTDNTDLDLYVIDPMGDYSAYYHPTTADGGVLDFDDTNGFGPEHWTLTYANTVRYGQPYTVRAHYYSDHGTGAGIGWHASILLNEGTSNQAFTEFSGFLASGNSGNTAPTGTGPDWADVAVVTPISPTQVVVRPGSGSGPLMVTAPVPGEDGRIAAKAAWSLQE